MKNINLCILLLIGLIAYTQEDCELTIQDYKKIPQPTAKDFEGEYQFGESEAEWDLCVLYNHNKLYARLGTYDFSKPELTYIIKRIEPYLDNGILKFKDYHATYSIYHSKYDNEKTIIEDNGTDNICWSGSGERTFKRPKGQYPETSFVKLTLEELQSYSKQELKIMRNEIFARRGHIFIRGGAMESYFSKQNWYFKKHKIGEDDLSDIEKHNIKTILLLEKY